MTDQPCLITPEDTARSLDWFAARTHGTVLPGPGRLGDRFPPEPRYCRIAKELFEVEVHRNATGYGPVYTYIPLGGGKVERTK
jgi:hypothetical protein